MHIKNLAVAAASLALLDSYCEHPFYCYNKLGAFRFFNPNNIADYPLCCYNKLGAFRLFNPNNIAYYPLCSYNKLGAFCLFNPNNIFSGLVLLDWVSLQLGAIRFFNPNNIEDQLFCCCNKLSAFWLFYPNNINDQLFHPSKLGALWLFYSSNIFNGLVLLDWASLQLGAFRFFNPNNIEDQLFYPGKLGAIWLFYPNNIDDQLFHPSKLCTFWLFYSSNIFSGLVLLDWASLQFGTLWLFYPSKLSAIWFFYPSKLGDLWLFYPSKLGAFWLFYSSDIFSGLVLLDWTSFQLGTLRLFYPSKLSAIWFFYPSKLGDLWLFYPSKLGTFWLFYPSKLGAFWLFYSSDIFSGLVLLDWTSFQLGTLRLFYPSKLSAIWFFYPSKLGDLWLFYPSKLGTFWLFYPSKLGTFWLFYSSDIFSGLVLLDWTSFQLGTLRLFYPSKLSAIWFFYPSKLGAFWLFYPSNIFTSIELGAFQYSRWSNIVYQFDPLVGNKHRCGGYYNNDQWHGDHNPCDQDKHYLPNLSSLRNFFCESLRNFAIDPRQQFSVVYSQASTGVGGQAAPPAAPGTGTAGGTIKSVFVLDSSFNPPTRDLLAEVGAEVADIDPGGLVIDIGLTKKPYFVGKAEAIDQSEVYGKGVEQVHLVGFDTLTRIFERKYYAELGLEVLTPFLKWHRLRVLARPDDEDDKKGWGTGKEQREWLEKMRRGELEELGCRKEWAERIELVDAEGAEVLGVSSTKARDAVKTGKWGDVDKLLGATVAAWVRAAGLYQEEAEDRAKSGVGP
ncbi:hypothetical protein DV736_g3362, partial [Chaetothyriales sp. CBS 134916]